MSGATTPGPWFVCSDDATQVRDADGDLVADCRRFTYTDDGEVDCPDNEGNARLIAAALDLLAACQSMIPTNVCLTNGNVPDSTIIPIDATMGDFRKIAAAIVKATGSPGASIAPPPAIPTPSARPSRPTERQQDPDHAQ